MRTTSSSSLCLRSASSKGSCSMPFAHRTEPAFVSQIKQCTLKFSERLSSLPNGSRNDFDST